MHKLLIMRFSAMGDVAMTVPVIHCLATQHPELRITVMTRGRFKPMFHWMPANVEVKAVELNDYKGLGGLGRLYKELKERRYDAVADLHDVLRTKYLRLRFRLSGVKVATINKGRADKKAFLGNGQKGKPLRPMVNRYADVFEQLGFPVTLDYQRAFNPRMEDFSVVRKAIGGDKPQGERWIGIAPFAAHEGKIYPLEQMKRVVDLLVEQGCKVFLFGAGDKELSILDKWTSDKVISVGRLLGGLHNEMLLMSRLDQMISMDSANMHIASIVGTPTLSIWGATHPGAGFRGWRQTDESIVQLDLPCRPCSVYGNKPCAFGDLRCMTGITPEMIVSKIPN